MNLIVDVGNTLVKFAIYQNKNLIHKVNFGLSEFNYNFNNIKKSFPEVEHAIISSVGGHLEKEINSLKKNLNVLELNSQTKLPFENLYKTPQTLGVDRMALVAASVYHYQEKNVLIIDAGTCITYDFINLNNQYLGGAISPGIRLRYISLNNLTANLPLLDTEQPKDIVGNTTETSIHSGVVFGVCKEMDGVIDQYIRKYSDLTVILTGGDANFLSNQLKNVIFANSNFLLDGLNFILEYNSK